MIRRFIDNLIASPFVRNVTVLTAGNLAAQMIPFLILPLCTRLFAPEMFAIQALLQVGMLFFAPIATGYYEWATPSPKHKREARAITTIAIFSATLFFMIAMLTILLLHDWLAEIFHLTPLGPWIYAYPFIILATALSSVANYWLLRTGNFKRQALNRISLTVSAAVITITLGLLSNKQGLVFGFVGGTILASFWAMSQALRCGLKLELHLPRRYFTKMLVKYKEFPIYGGLPSALNNLAAQVPLLIITATYGLGIAGHYAVARGLLSSGAGLISVCIGQVVLKHFADLTHQNERLWPYFLKISKYICFLGLSISAGIYFVGPWFFSLYLGSAWSDSTEIIRILSINVLFWLLGPSVAMAVVAIKKLRMIALWQVIYAVMASCLLLFRHLSFEQFMHRVVLFECIAYALYFVIMTIAIRRHDAEQQKLA